MTEATSNFIYHFIFRNKKTIKSLIESLEYIFNQTCSTENAVKEKIFERIKLKEQLNINKINDLLNEDIEQAVKDNIKNSAETYAKKILKKAKKEKGWRKLK